MVQEQLPRREILHSVLSGIVTPAYFQAPTNIKMQYPCITYDQDSAETLFADNNPYRYIKRYQVTVIDQDPDSPYPDLIAKLPMCRFDRKYTADDLHHFVFNLFF